MTCRELEKLEAQNEAICTRALQPGMTDDEREKLQIEIVALVFKIREHQDFGHDGQPCPDA
jgi:hypothetical protein